MIKHQDWDPKNPIVPVDKQGNWMSYPSHGDQKWHLVVPFKAVMRIDGMQTGRSSKVIILRDDYNGATYPMFVSDFIKVVQEGKVDIYSKDGVGYLTATWTASKRGANYGIKAL